MGVVEVGAIGAIRMQVDASDGGKNCAAAPFNLVRE